jgi:hypothetical protein
MVGEGSGGDDFNAGSLSGAGKNRWQRARSPRIEAAHTLPSVPGDVRVKRKCSM